MARDQKPVTAAELASFAEEMDDQAVALHEALAEDLGGNPEDYRMHRVTDGGD